MHEIEFNGEIYETEDQAFLTENGAVFLPQISRDGSVFDVEPGSEEDMVLRSDENTDCLNALAAYEVYRRQNGTIAIFADLKSDDDQVSDLVGTGADFQTAVADLLSQVKATYPSQCYCINPADDDRFK